ncbi:histidinol-phosphatase [Galactobacter sp.]|uniref:histidinol-phosphatase n=1 Tax=Galactobacter sp. TaxID=2676125 RepID=UPI0025BB27BB|nr:histidinol-phosphatase [Galactobacter sp.]
MGSMASHSDDLHLAHLMAEAVDEVTLRRFHSSDLVVETKPDLTPVTDADKRAEESIRGHLGRARPRDAVYGEEFGTSGHSDRTWIIDPIDGTKNFVRGVPVWATLIGLVEEGEVVVGMVSAPALNRRWWAAKDQGAYVGRSLAQSRRLRVSKVSRLEDASLSYSSLTGWRENGHLDGMLNLQDRIWRSRGYGDFFSYTLLAEGAVDIATEPELNLYDMAALVPLVTEAGGRFTSLQGEDGPFGGNALATNSLLHDEVLSVLGTLDDEPTPTPIPR